MRTLILCLMTLILIFTHIFFGISSKKTSPQVYSLAYNTSILQAAEINDLHPALIAAVIQAESNFNPRAVSMRGAMGLMQITPGTGRKLKLRNAFDPHQNIAAGSRYLRELIDLFDGDLTLALAAYNAGPDRVLQYDGVPPFRQTRTYIRKVMAFFDLYRSVLPTT